MRKSALRHWQSVLTEKLCHALMGCQSEHLPASSPQVIAELRSLLEGVTIEKRAMQSSAAREQTQHSRSTPGSPQASPPPSPPRQSSDTLPSSLPPHQSTEPLARLLRGSMLDRPLGSGFTIQVAASETDDVSRTSSGGSQPGNAGIPGPAESLSLQQHSGVGTSPLGGAQETQGAPPALLSALPTPQAVELAQQTPAGAARTAEGRLADRGIGKVDTKSSQAQQRHPDWLQTDESVRYHASGGPRALPDGGYAPATPSMEGRRQAVPPGAAASATSSLTESAALDSAAHANPGLQPGSVPVVGRTLAGRLEAAGPPGGAASGATRQSVPMRTGAMAEQARQQVAGLATALGRHEDWGSAWGAGLSVLPSGASVSDASAASPVSSVDLIAPRPSCIVDVAAEPIVSPKAEPSPPGAIDDMLRTALGMADLAEDPSDEVDASLKTVSTAADAGDSPRLCTLLPMLQPQQRRRTLVTRSADTESRKDPRGAHGHSTGRSSAPVVLSPWRTVVPTSVFALSEPGQQLEAAALATR